jgi:hypothetical protein
MAARKKLDLTKAKVADGALAAPRSVYEMVGISTHSYGTNNRAEYEATINHMNLIELQDEAYKHGVLASESRSITIDRLLEKFVHEQTKFSSTTDDFISTASKKTQKAALEALARGR